MGPQGDHNGFSLVSGCQFSDFPEDFHVTPVYAIKNADGYYRIYSRDIPDMVEYIQVFTGWKEGAKLIQFEK
jgi:hypothetical protein